LKRYTFDGLSGISASVVQGGKTLEVEWDGLVSALKKGHVKLEVRIESGQEVHALDVGADENRTVRLLDHPELDLLEGASRGYDIQFPILSGKGGVYTKYPKNQIRLMIVGDDYAIEIWQIAVAAQHGMLFLAATRQYDCGLFQSEDGDLACPYFEPWSSFLEILDELFGDRIDQLAPIDDCPEEQEVDPSAVEIGRGFVRRWDVARNVGTVVTRFGEAKIYFKAVPPRPEFQDGERCRHRYLEKWEEVDVVDISFPKGQTNFGMEIFKVKFLGDNYNGEMETLRNGRPPRSKQTDRGRGSDEHRQRLDHRREEVRRRKKKTPRIPRERISRGVSSDVQK